MPVAFARSLVITNPGQHTMLEGGGLFRASCPPPSGLPLRGIQKRSRRFCRTSMRGSHPPRQLGRQGKSWWRGEDSNLRRLSQQIYSLPPLATREPLQKRGRIFRKIASNVNSISGIFFIGPARPEKPSGAMPMVKRRLAQYTRACQYEPNRHCRDYFSPGKAEKRSDATGTNR